MVTLKRPPSTFRLEAPTSSGHGGIGKLQKVPEGTMFWHLTMSESRWISNMTFLPLTLDFPVADERDGKSHGGFSILGQPWQVPLGCSGHRDMKGPSHCTMWQAHAHRSMPGVYRGILYPWQARGKDRVTDVAEACIGHVGRQEVTQGEIT